MSLLAILPVVASSHISLPQQSAYTKAMTSDKVPRVWPKLPKAGGSTSFTANQTAAEAAAAAAAAAVGPGIERQRTAPPGALKSPLSFSWDLFNPSTEDFVLLDPATPCF